ncbi:hypothetical protein [Pseudoalteromonas arctica]|uniref:hypothetical protein n=1 Tax=Pseudoalteromonas arctica TaxID=394751 RepID=UPI00026D0DEB|nr:hypothetical protein [Pseudoalteromonas arctica]
MTFIVTEMDLNEGEISSHSFENPHQRDYVICSNNICSRPHKFILQDGKNINDGDTFICNGNEKKGNSGQFPDRCDRFFIVTKK